MSWIDKLFSTTKSAAKTVETASEISEAIVEGTISGIDKLVFTPEEKADYLATARETLLKFWGTFQNENNIRSIARRELAKMSFQVFFFLILAATFLFPFQPEYAKFVFGIVKELFWLINAICLTYFVPHQVSKIWKSPNVK